MSFGLQSSSLRPPWDTTCALQPQMQTLGLMVLHVLEHRTQNEAGERGRQDITQTHSLDIWTGFLEQKNWSSLISAIPALISGQLVSLSLFFFFGSIFQPSERLAVASILGILFKHMTGTECLHWNSLLTFIWQLQENVLFTSELQCVLPHSFHDVASSN